MPSLVFDVSRETLHTLVDIRDVLTRIFRVALSAQDECMLFLADFDNLVVRAAIHEHD